MRKSILAEPGELAVGVEAAAPNRRREVVDLAGPDAIAVGFGVAVGARLDQRVGPQEVAEHELDLVVAHVTERAERRVEREEVVAPLLEHDDRPARGGQHLGRGRTRGPGPDDHRVAVDRPTVSHVR